MKIYLAFLIFMLLSSYLAGRQLVKHYEPSVALLENTTLVTGRLHFYDRGRGGYIAQLNGTNLMCRMNFLGAQKECPEILPNLHEGDRLTAAIAYVPALLRTVPLAMSISTDGGQVYTVTAVQVIDEWRRSSRGALLAGPALVLFLLFLMPLLLSANFRDFLMSSLS